MDEAAEMLMGMGCKKPISKLKIDDKSMLKSSLIDYYCLLKVKAEMDQFAEGLKDLGLLETMRHHPSLFKSLSLLPLHTSLRVSLYPFKGNGFTTCRLLVVITIFCVPGLI